jgi:UDP-N-acetyl-D-mannosaminuronate dehydrogenase
MTRLGRSINDSMPAYCVDQAMKLLDTSHIVGEHPVVALLGLAFRGGVSDTRLSPTYDIIKELNRRGVRKIRIHDPLVRSDPRLSQEIMLTRDLAIAVSGADLVMLISDHREYHHLDPERLGSAAVYDGRGILSGSKFNSRFAAIGRPTGNRISIAEKRISLS